MVDKNSPIITLKNTKNRNVILHFINSDNFEGKIVGKVDLYNMHPFYTTSSNLFTDAKSFT